jgi:hypothetical protein
MWSIPDQANKCDGRNHKWIFLSRSSTQECTSITSSLSIRLLVLVLATIWCAELSNCIEWHNQFLTGLNLQFLSSAKHLSAALCCCSIVGWVMPVLVLLLNWYVRTITPQCNTWSYNKTGLDGLHCFGGDLAWAGVNTSNATTHPLNEMAMITSINILAWRGRQI